MLLPAVLMGVSSAIGVHDLHYNLFHDIPVTLRQVIPFVFGKDGQEEDWYGLVMIVIDDPYTTAFAPCSDSPAPFPDPACPDHNDAIFRMAHNAPNELLPLCLSHPCGSPLPKLTGFDHGPEACIAALAFRHERSSLGVRHCCI